MRLRRINASSRIAVVGAAALFSMGWSAVANAQTVPSITISPNVARFASDGVTPLADCATAAAGQACLRPSTEHQTDINFADCENDVVLAYTVSLSAPTTFADSGLQMQVFAGSDCTDNGNRESASGSCWQAVNAIPPDLTTDFTVRVRARDVVAGQRAPLPNGRAPHPGYPAGTEDDCRFTQPSTAPLALTLYFMFLETQPSVGRVLAPGSVPATTPLSIALIAAAPPATPVAGTGDGQLDVSWTAVTDENVAGYNIYCDPLPGHETDAGADVVATPAEASTTLECPDTGAGGGATDAGEAGASDAAAADAATGDAGASDAATGDASATDAATGDAGAATADAGCTSTSTTTPTPQPTAGECGASRFPAALATSGASAATSTVTTVTTDASDDGATASADGATATATTTTSGPGGLSPPSASQFLCGTVTGRAASSFTLTGVLDGDTYHVAVAAFDAYGNVGPLSAAACGTPARIDDFWNGYWLDGGRAGGGFCAIDGAGMGGSLSAMFLVATGAVGAFVRRRRK